MSTSHRLPPQFRDLTPSQQQAFEDLKQLCIQNNLYWPVSDLENVRGLQIPDDIILHRYIRARSYILPQAYKQLAETVKWRTSMGLDHAYDTVPIPQFETLRRLQPQWTGRCDKNGVPIFVYVVSQIDPKDLHQLGKDDPELKSIFLAGEYVMNFVNPLASHVRCKSQVGGGGCTCTTVNIIDLSNVGISKFWSLRRLLQTASSMATAHYPETVERIFVVGAPTYFSTIWRLITQWFDPQTTRKIRVLSKSENTRALTEFIEPQNLPKRYGGELEWEFGMHPNLASEIAGIVAPMASQWIEGPIRHVSGSGNDSFLAVGTENGQERKAVVTELPKVNQMNEQEKHEITGESIVSTGTAAAPAAAA